MLDPQVIEYGRQRASSKLRRWRDAETGMCMTMLALDPIRDAVLKKAFDAHLNRLRSAGATSGRPWSEVEVDAFMSMVAASVVSRGAGSGGSGRSTRCDTTGSSRPVTSATPARPAASAGPAASVVPATSADLSALRAAVHLDDLEAVPTSAALNVPEVCAVVGWDRVLDDACTNGLCETSDGQPIAPASLRRMLCDAAVYPVILGGDGQVLDAGRTTRTVTPAQRQALRAMHRTCGNPTCRVPFDSCRIHHIRWWTRDLGPTDLENLLPLCEKDHHMVHEGGWTLTMTPDRVATWIRPDGMVWITASTVDRSIDALGLEPHFPERTSDD
jgi:hypothetical protein